MLHRVDGENVLDAGLIYHRPFKLAAFNSVRVPALCLGMVPHRLTLRTHPGGLDMETLETPPHSFILLVGEPNVLMSHGLLIVPRVITDGDVFTHVFNLSNKEMLVRKGEVLSRLVRVLGSVWDGNE